MSLRTMPATTKTVATGMTVPADVNGELMEVKAVSPPVLSSSPTPFALLVALRRRWLLALTLGLLAGAGGAAAIWYLQPISWSVRTVLHISSNRPFIFFENADARADFANYQRSQLFLVRSRTVLNAALRDPGVASLAVVQSQLDPVDWLDKELKADFAAGPEILTIKMNGDSPETMTKLVNAVRDAYMREIVGKEQNDRLKRVNQIQKLYSKYDDLLRDKRQKLKELANALGGEKTEVLLVNQMFLRKDLDDLHAQMRQVQSQTRKLKVEYQIAQADHQALKESKVPEDIVEEKLKQYPVVTKLQKSIMESEVRLQTLKETLRHPETDQIFLAEKDSLARTRVALESQRKELRPAIQRETREGMMAQATAALYREKQELAMLQGLEKSVEEQVNSKKLEIQLQGKGGINLDYLKEEIAQTGDLQKKVGEKKEALEAEIGAPARVSILDDGFVVQTRDQKSRIVSASLGGLGLFGFVLVGLAFLEFRSRRVSGLDEIVHGLGLPLIGVLPHVPAHALIRQVKKSPNGHWQQLLSESVDATRAMLVHAAKNKSLSVVMVSSALKGEGKTLVSSHLAISMALAGFKTLLIDADMRCPALHRLFDLPSSPGLNELLRQQVDLESVMYSELLQGLSVIPAGHWDQALVKLLAQQRLGAVLDSLKKSFDFIIIDTAPILPTSDTLLIAQHVDGILLSVLRDVSRLPMVHLAQERLAMLGTRILGAVVGGTAFDGGYGYRYGLYGPTTVVS